MPVLPPQTASILDPLYSILNAAKVRLNDAVPSLQAVSGKLLNNNNEFTRQVVNNGWRKMLEFCGNRGLTALKQEAVIYQLPGCIATDPAIPMWIDWFNSYDGANLYTQPVLPADLIVPLKVWERPSNLNCAFPSNPMELFFDGLPMLPKQLYNGMWEWRANRIYIPGALQKIDLRILYARYLGDFADGAEQWFEQEVPLPRCQDPFSLYICAEIAETREDLDQAYWLAKAEGAAVLFCNRDVQMKQRGTIRRQSRSGRLEMNSGVWW